MNYFLSPCRCVVFVFVAKVLFFADEMAMFTGSTYYDMGHIMPLTS